MDMKISEEGLTEWILLVAVFPYLGSFKRESWIQAR